MALSQNDLEAYKSRIQTPVASGGDALLRQRMNEMLSKGPTMASQKKTTVTPIKSTPSISTPIKITPTTKKIDLSLLQKAQQTVTDIGTKVGGAVGKLANFLPEKTSPIQITPTQKKLDKVQLKQLQGLDTQQQTSATITTQAKEQTVSKLKQIRENFRTKSVEEVRRPIKKGYKEPGVLGSMAEALQEGSVSLVSSLGASTEMVGNMSNMILLTKAGQKIQKEADKVLASNPEWAADPLEKWNTKKVARLVTGAVPSLLAVIAATMVAGPAGATLAGFWMEAGPTYKESKQAGATERQAQIYGTAVGTINGILEKIFPAELLKGGGKETVKKVGKSLWKDVAEQAVKYGVKFTKSGALEGSTEALQEMWSNVIATNYDKNRQVWNNLLESFVGGFGSGGIAGVTEQTTNIRENLPPGENDPQTVINEVLKQKAENTEEGKTLIKEAVQAQKTGEKVVIEKPVEQPSTPQGGVDSLIQEARKYKSAEEFASKMKTNELTGTTYIPMELNVADLKPSEALTVKKAGRKIYEPISVIYDLDKNELRIPDGHNRYAQAIANGQKTINAEVAFVKNNDATYLTKEKLIDSWNKSQPSTPQGGVEQKVEPNIEAKAIEKVAGTKLTDKATGLPIKVYTGQKAGYSMSNPMKVGSNDYSQYGSGIYFSPNKEIAQSYAQKGGQLYEAYLDIKNPLKVGSKNWSTFLNKPTADLKLDYLKRMGYDGIIDLSKKYPQVLVVDPKQVQLVEKSQETKVQPKEVLVPKQQLPVGEGKQKISKLEARMKGVLGNATPEQIEQLGLSTRNVAENDKQIAKASEYIINNRKDAIAVLEGEKDAPPGILRNALFVAMAQEAKTDMTLATKLASLSATRYGQELQILSEIDKNSPVKLLNEVYKVKEEEATKKYKDLNKARKNGVENIKKEIKTVNKYDWNAFISSIDTC